MIKPINFSVLTELFHKVCGRQKPENEFQLNDTVTALERNDLVTQVTQMLLRIGIPAHIKGYTYLRFAIITAVKDAGAIYLVTKILYPTVAREFHTTASRVERAMRHAIEVAWDRGDIEVQSAIFGYTVNSNRGKPTNSEFIALIADNLRLKY